MQNLSEMEIESVNGAKLFGKIVGAIVVGAVTRSPMGVAAGILIGDHVEDMIDAAGKDLGID